MKRYTWVHTTEKKNIEPNLVENIGYDFQQVKITRKKNKQIQRDFWAVAVSDPHKRARRWNEKNKSQINSHWNLIVIEFNYSHFIICSITKILYKTIKVKQNSSVWHWTNKKIAKNVIWFGKSQAMQIFVAIWKKHIHIHTLTVLKTEWFFFWVW